MSEFSAVKDETELEAQENLEGVQSFDIDLFAEGDGDSGFHTKNDPNQPFQRSNIVQRKGAVDVKCTCVDIIHGKWAPDSNDRATLIVLLFRFDPRKRSRRIAEAEMVFKFFDMSGNNYKNPEVAKMSLDQSCSLVPTKRTESITSGSEGSLGGGAFGATLSGTLKWEKKYEQETSDATHVVGSIDQLGTETGPNNAASWSLYENATMKTGVPAAIRVGVLLKRKGDNDFKCTVELKTKVDLKTQMEQLFGGKPPDDPILFKTDLPPTNNLMKYDSNSLGSFDLSAVEDVTFTTVREGAVKTHSG